MAHTDLHSESEIWKPVVGFEGFYEASSFGRIKSLSRIINSHNRYKAITRISKERIMRFNTNSGGYHTVELYRDRARARLLVSRLVCEAFHGPCGPDLQCAHLDGTRTNNRADNLAWVTRCENMAHKLIHGTMMRGERHTSSKLTEEEVLKIRQLVSAGVQQLYLAELYGVSPKTVNHIATRKNWKHIS